MGDLKSKENNSPEESGEEILLQHVLDGNSEVQLLKGLLSRARSELGMTRHIVANQTDAIIYIDTAQRIVYANSVFCNLVGYELPDLEKTMFDQFFMLHGRGPGLKALLKTVANQGKWNGEVLFRQGDKDQSPLNMSIIFNGSEDHQHEKCGFVCQISAEDIIPLTQTTQSSSPKITYDSLTGLPDRPSCLQYLAFCLKQARENDGGVAVLYIDLDQFKRVNNIRGPSFGDELLCEISSILLQCGKQCGADFVARLSGDEFVIILAPLVKPEMAKELSDRILKQFQHPIAIKSRDIFIKLSIGISLYPEDSDNQPGLLHNAETAMEMAKTAGGNSSYRWHSKMDAAANQNLDLESDLFEAVKNSDLVNNYQPQINIKTGAIVGMEALARWNHPEHGFISPEIFIPVAEDVGLIDRLSFGLIELACRHGRQWHDVGIKGFTMAVNISGRMLQQADLFEKIMDILRKTGFPPTSLELELTESALIESFDNTIHLINQCKEEGIKMALDDFGTGYSSLSYLQRFAVDKLKIDRAFVMGVTTSHNDAAITLAIIAMAKQLNFKVLAEGVETEAQLSFLKENGCDVVQGFLISKPITAEEMKNALIHDSCLAIRQRRAINKFYSMKASKLPAHHLKPTAKKGFSPIRKR
ncbi:MAG: EAL domain-containing protein [Desulfocapsa sp.]|nr:EAL domain-containing protein [Desulfocapsa sp.]